MIKVLINSFYLKQDFYTKTIIVLLCCFEF
jgi:hypothetical protein